MTRRLSALRSSRTFRLHASPHPVFDRMRFLFTMSEIEGRKERRRTEVLSPAIRPSSRQALTRSTKLMNRIGRIGALQSARHVVKTFKAQTLVEPDGIEPTTSCLQSTRSPN